MRKSPGGPTSLALNFGHRCAHLSGCALGLAVAYLMEPERSTIPGPAGPDRFGFGLGNFERARFERVGGAIDPGGVNPGGPALRLTAVPKEFTTVGA